MTKKSRTLTIIVCLLFFQSVCFSFMTDTHEYPAIWVVEIGEIDSNTELAIDTTLNQIQKYELLVKVIDFSKINRVSKGNIVVLVGHGAPEGVQIHDETVNWDVLYQGLLEIEPSRAIVLACYAPSVPEKSIFGFNGVVDAVAGGLLATWLMSEAFDEPVIKDIPFGEIIEAQRNMLHPLARILYFVHSYYGSTADFADLIQSLFVEGDMGSEYSTYQTFSYYSAYGVSDDDPDAINILHYTTSIEDYGDDLYDELSQYPSGTQINFVAHSMGGIITVHCKLDRSGHQSFVLPEDGTGTGFARVRSCVKTPSLKYPYRSYISTYTTMSRFVLIISICSRPFYIHKPPIIANDTISIYNDSSVVLSDYTNDSNSKYYSS